MRTSVLVLAASIAGLIVTCGFGSVAEQNAGLAMDADVIVTAAPVYAPLAALKGGERFPKGAQLLLVHAGKAAPLMTGFAATADANVGFDGKTVLFAGRQTAGDAWQIWEMTLADRAVRLVVAGEGDAIRPFYLPGGRVVYARRTAQGFRLEAAGKDGGLLNAAIDASAGDTILPLSYMPGSAVPVDVLMDGRILFEAGFPLGSGATPELYLVYSDGSGVESYRCGVHAWRFAGAVYFSAGARSGDCCTACGICRRDCGDCVWRMVGEYSDRCWWALFVEFVGTGKWQYGWCIGAEDGACREWRGHC